MVEFLRDIAICDAKTLLEGVSDPKNILYLYKAQNIRKVLKMDGIEERFRMRVHPCKVVFLDRLRDGDVLQWATCLEYRGAVMLCSGTLPYPSGTLDWYNLSERVYEGVRFERNCLLVRPLLRLLSLEALSQVADRRVRIGLAIVGELNSAEKSLLKLQELHETQLPFSGKIVLDITAGRWQALVHTARQLRRERNDY